VKIKNLLKKKNNQLKLKFNSIKFMLLFVGLGNPTPDSENNRHNVGFKIIDSINKKFSLSKQKPKFKGFLTTGNIE
jgi:peptidyl-tRNA hydrolase